ncbi:hypothetical protein IWX83_000079 [Flavobacterium sp. CG_9.1]|uniref:hypothetical protein n=1 Tax=Flavobacterium sp. CG_9.1 TaxID=2787728 RepID=UPI0018CA8554|nr:hypothetical protein [Flavobacterium sp. CG_9.1]MBG6060316.1 hypothetical protein [Flavobacterium sp. CG_9.1]
MFTALAVVAFTGVSMAGTEEVKEEVKIDVSKNKSVIDDNLCEQMAINSYEYITSHYEVVNESALLNYLIGRCHPEYKGKLSYTSS